MASYQIQNNSPLSFYNIFFVVQVLIHVSYPNQVLRVKYIGYIGKDVLDAQLGSNTEPYYTEKSSC